MRAVCGQRAGLALGLGLGLALLLAAQRRRRAVREVLFFPSQPCCTEELLAEAEGCDGRPAPCPCPLPRADCSLSRLLRRLLSARRSLELCLFAFSSPELGRAVCVLHRRGVRIRVVTDSQYMALRGSQIGVLRLLGELPGQGQACLVGPQLVAPPLARSGPCRGAWRQAQLVALIWWQRERNHV
uniref:Mitochondrial cardiolipin hydrolase n=1 Tax=Pavo cristatus TaxID=9049 RepID=A0A8C9G2Y7_PAVCR